AHDIPAIAVVFLRSVCARVAQTIGVTHLLTKLRGKRRIAVADRLSTAAAKEIRRHIHAHEGAPVVVERGARSGSRVSCPSDQLVPPRGVGAAARIFRVASRQREPAEYSRLAKIDVAVRHVAEIVDHVPGSHARTTEQVLVVVVRERLRIVIVEFALEYRPWCIHLSPRCGRSRRLTKMARSTMAAPPT